MGRDVANESASEFSRWNARSRLFGRLRGLHGLCLTPRRPARLCPELSFRMLFSCADTQSRSTCLSARSRTTPPPLCRGPVPSFMWSELRHALVPINGPRCFVLGHFGLNVHCAAIWKVLGLGRAPLTASVHA